MEEKMKFGLMLSLKEISLRRVAVILWNHPDILISIDNLGAEDAVVKNMRKLELPPTLTEQMKHIIQHIGSEINIWSWFNQKFLKRFSNSLISSILKQLYWTVLGTVDYRETAGKLIRIKMFDIVESYRLACLYCLDYHIGNLWKQFTEERKNYFYDENERPRGTRVPLQFCWPFILKGQENKLVDILKRSLGYTTSFNQYAFEYSVWTDNKPATEYFFRKLTEVEKEASLFKAAQTVAKNRHKYVNPFPILFYSNFPRQKWSDNFCYLLSLVNSQQQMDIFKAYPTNVLEYFLDWPWQNHFLNIAEIVWTFLTATDYVYLLKIISSRIQSQNCVCYSKLFQELFLRGVSDFKEDFIDKECTNGSCFTALFKGQDTETIKIILRNVDSVDRKRLLSSSPVLKLFLELILTCEFRAVEICLHEANFSEEDKEVIKEEFHRFLAEYWRHMKGIDISDINLRDNLRTSFLHLLYERKVDQEE